MLLKLTLTILLFTIPARATQYEVFLLAGQSNMDGRGAIKDLTGPLEKWTHPQPDVLISYSNSGTRGPLLATKEPQPLAPGYSVAPGKPPPTTLPAKTFGAEVSLGRTLADAMPGKHVLLIKFVEGGTNLKSQWNPDVRDKLYDQFVARVGGELKSLTARGDTYTLRALVWHQGESDAKLSAEEYESLLKALIAKARADFDAKDLPVLIGEVYDNGQRDTIRAAQRAAAKDIPHVVFVPCDGMKTIDNGTHFDALSQIEFGIRYATAILAKF